jgi:hypothetical protein
MGEIAEMMLDGTMCAGCGEFLHEGEDGEGFPEYCYSCRRTEDKCRRERQSQRDKISNETARMVIEYLEVVHKGKMPNDIGRQLATQIKGIVSGVYNATGKDLMHDGCRKTIENNSKQKRNNPHPTIARRDV